LIVLHAIWPEHSGLAVFGEDSTRPLRRGRRPKTPDVRAHPFACDAETIASALAEVAGSFAGITAVETNLQLLLPSTPAAPLPSPFLPVLHDGDVATPELVAWRVPAQLLTSPGALDALLAVGLNEKPHSEVLIGDSLLYYAEVAKLALELVAGGRVVPALERSGGDDFAVWRPVLRAAQETNRLIELATALPPVCRAAEPERAPRRIVVAALEALVDACVRESLVLEPPPWGELPAGRAKRIPAARAVWVTALCAADPRVAGKQSELEKLSRDLNAWLEPITGAPSDARTCFRLTPPNENEPEDDWRLEFLLQSLEDPSLLVPAVRIWETPRADVDVLGRTFRGAHEQLLADLGRALRLFPPLARALRTAAPVGMELTVAEAHRFLREAAPLFEQAGFTVLIPQWWKKPPVRLGVRMRAQPRETQAGLGLEQLCDYEWQLALGDQTLSADEFRRLANLKVPLVRMRGQWVELRPEQIEAALALLDRNALSGTMTVSDVVRLGLGVAPAATGLPVVGFDGTGWLNELLSAGPTQSRTMQAPDAFAGTLRPYQERGLAWLAFLDKLALGACLADDMGLGKTIQLLALLLSEREQAKDRVIAPTLLVCPMSVVGNWQHEAARFAPALRVHVHHGGERLSGEQFARILSDVDLVVTTYGLVARDQEQLAAVRWERVVLDEAQNIKNSAARQAQAVRMLPAARRIALTGTPIENRLSELWSIFHFLNPGLLGSASEFRKRFATPIERYHDRDSAETLKRITAPFILRRLKTDRTIISDLPDKMEMKVYCNLTREQATLYQAVVDEMLEKIANSEGIERRGLVLSTMLKLKQVCNHPAQLLGDGSALPGRSGKVAHLEEMLDEVLSDGDRALVFTQFAEMGRLLQAHLQKRLARPVPFLHGSTSMKARDAMVAGFQAEDGQPVMLISLKAGGTGLNLTAANHVVHFDRWWNPAVEDQATDRAFRIGQNRNVQVRKFICAGTLEERIDAMIEDKKDLAGRIVGAGEAWLTELSTAELRQLVALSKDAVVE
jgi:non-specific serine/threonine protein kinase